MASANRSSRVSRTEPARSNVAWLSAIAASTGVCQGDRVRERDVEEVAVDRQDVVERSAADREERTLTSSVAAAGLARIKVPSAAAATHRRAWSRHMAFLLAVVLAVMRKAR
jgi:hypothetical protein